MVEGAMRPGPEQNGLGAAAMVHVLREENDRQSLRAQVETGRTLLAEGKGVLSVVGQRRRKTRDVFRSLDHACLVIEPSDIIGVAAPSRNVGHGSGALSLTAASIRARDLYHREGLGDAGKTARLHCPVPAMIEAVSSIQIANLGRGRQHHLREQSARVRKRIAWRARQIGGELNGGDLPSVDGQNSELLADLCEPLGLVDKGPVFRRLGPVYDYRKLELPDLVAREEHADSAGRQRYRLRDPGVRENRADHPRKRAGAGRQGIVGPARACVRPVVDREAIAERVGHGSHVPAVSSSSEVAHVPGAGSRVVKAGHVLIEGVKVPVGIPHLERAAAPEILEVTPRSVRGLVEAAAHCLTEKTLTAVRSDEAEPARASLLAQLDSAQGEVPTESPSQG